MSIKQQESKYSKSQSGQTLIETIVAIFVLTMALTTALGLAIYAYSASAISQNEIIASNLAREGIEMVRVMRDTNWLVGDLNNNFGTCNDPQLPGSTQCYTQAFDSPYNLQVTGSPNKYRLDLNLLNYPTNVNNLGTSNDMWKLTTTSNFNLYLQPDGTYTSNACAGCAVNFVRKINFFKNTSAPYSNQNYELRAQSIVAWNSKRCPNITGLDPETTTPPCKVVVEERFTNWKDYK